MNLTLSSEEQARLGATARALLSSLDADSVDRWRADVLERLADLLQADGAGFILPVKDGPPYTLHEMPDRFAHDFFELGGDDDPVVQKMRRDGGGVWSTRLVGAQLGLRVPEDWYATEEYRSLYGRYQVRDAIGFMAFPDVNTTPPPHLEPEDPAAAMLTCFRQEFGTELFGERGVAMLGLLLPALEAGVATRVRMAGRTRALEQAFDTAGYGIAVHGLDARRIYANRTFGRLVERDPDRDRLLRPIDAGVRTIRGLFRTRERPPPEDLSEVSREVRTDRARYRIRLNLIGEGLFTDEPSILVALERLTPRRPTIDELRERWGLTPQEARVATHLADGRTNRQIAEAMELSPATTRHYSERVFRKLGVHSRAKAAVRILAD